MTSLPVPDTFLSLPTYTMRIFQRRIFAIVLVLLGSSIGNSVFAEGTLHGLTLRVFQLRPRSPRDEPPVVTAVAARVGGDDHDIHVWNVKTGSFDRKLRGHTDWICSLVFSPDGKTLVSARNDRRILFWNTDSGRQVRGLARHNQAITAVQFDPTGRYLASTEFETQLRVYDVHTGQLLQVVDCPCSDM